jgi:hypothetical protein
MVYVDFLVDHVWKIWLAWQRGEKAVGRMYFVHPTVMWTLIPPPLTYYRIRRDLFRTSSDCWQHRAFDISSYLRNIGITIGQHIMGHVHARSMYQSRRKEAKESLCDFLTILFSFEYGSVMGKTSKWYVARYAALTHYEWRHCRGCLQRHPTIPRDQINVDKQRFARLFENAACFAAYRNATCQSLIGYRAWLR